METYDMDSLFEQDAVLEKYQDPCYLEAAKAMLKHEASLSDEAMLGAKAVLLLNGCL